MATFTINKFVIQKLIDILQMQPPPWHGLKFCAATNKTNRGIIGWKDGGYA
jgi:hypothetical protein